MFDVKNQYLPYREKDVLWIVFSGLQHPKELTSN